MVHLHKIDGLLSSLEQEIKKSTNASNAKNNKKNIVILNIYCVNGKYEINTLSM